jgi:zinc transporter ZupT
MRRCWCLVRRQMLVADDAGPVTSLVCADVGALCVAMVADRAGPVTSRSLRRAAHTTMAAESGCMLYALLLDFLPTAINSGHIGAAE